MTEEMGRTIIGGHMAKKKRSPIPIVFGLILVVVCIGLAGKVLQRFLPTKEKMDLSKYYNIAAQDQMAVVYNHEVMKFSGIYINGHPYLDYNIVHDYLNERFYEDQNENILLYTTATDVIKIPLTGSDMTNYTISQQAKTSDYAIATIQNQTLYIALDFVKQYTKMDFTYYDNPSRVVILTDYSKQMQASIKSETQIRYRGGIKSPILTQIQAKDTVTVLKKDNTWSKVASKDGLIGYIKTNTLTSEKEVTPTNTFQETFTHNLKNFKINMVWNQVTNVNANAKVVNTLASTKGVNVISPTWFYLNSNQGDIASLASEDYVTYCHQNKIEVWGLVSNLENKNVSTTKVLTHTSLREHLENQIMTQAVSYGLDGINIDFESVRAEVGDGYIQFIRELSLLCRKNGLVLSVDNYVPTSGTMFYNRKEQAVFADYVIMMGYDEHYSGSDSGSVASIGYVTNGIKEMIAQKVPANQIILGMPFYTRLWTETDSASGTTVTSKTLGMKDEAAFLAQNNAQKTWSQKDGQNYVQVKKDNVTYKVWLEDEKSLSLKLQLINDYSLAGGSFWKLGLEDPSIWNTIAQYMAK